LTTETVGDVTVMTPAADALASNPVAAFKQTAAALPPCGKVLLDLSSVSFLDSAGCGAILHLHRKVTESGGEFRVCGPKPGVRALFEQMRMARVLTLHATRAEALRAFD
jgi:anti-sigma B factor antagonist